MTQQELPLMLIIEKYTSVSRAAQKTHRGEVHEQEQDDTAGKQPCRSLFRQKGPNTYYGAEHSPLIFERDNLMVCRTPKIGSTELRLIKKAYEKEGNFTLGKPKTVGAVLHRESNVSRFNDLVHGDGVDRIMFVRHPVRRILSGFLQLARGKRFWTSSYDFWAPLGDGPAAFRLWLQNSTFVSEYDSKCSDLSTKFSKDEIKQHFLPPQHCRCGLWDCGVKWERFKIEEQSISTVMGRKIPGPWIPTPSAPRVNAKRYREGDYLTRDILELLNRITHVEQEMFGYDPLVFR